MAESIKSRTGAMSDQSSKRELQKLLEAMRVDLVAIRAPLAGALTGSATWDAGSLADGVGESKDITVTGAALGDFVMVSMGVDVVDIGISAQVTAANTVTARLQNESTATVNLASTTVRAVVLPFGSFVAPAAITTTA